MLTAWLPQVDLIDVLLPCDDLPLCLVERRSLCNKAKRPSVPSVVHGRHKLFARPSNAFEVLIEREELLENDDCQSIDAFVGAPL
jgi:hypothetical protein